MFSKNALPLLLLLILTVGCSKGSSEYTLYSLSGEVKYNGDPVPVGEVSLEPAEGNKGPMVIAPIKDGRYETPDGKGVVGGPYKVRILGRDGVPFEMSPGMVEENGKLLFPQYETTLDLPKENSTHNFDVPAKTE